MLALHFLTIKGSLSWRKKDQVNCYKEFLYTLIICHHYIFIPVFRKIELFVSKWLNSLFCNMYIMCSNCYLLSDHTMYIYPGMSKWKIKISLLPNSSCWIFLSAEDLVLQHNFICLREIFAKYINKFCHCENFSLRTSLSSLNCEIKSMSNKCLLIVYLHFPILHVLPFPGQSSMHIQEL